MMPSDKPPRRKLEREFGVPIAGEILPPERWTKTALKRLPHGSINPCELFGRSAPLVVDLGCGNGRFLLGSAVWRPDHDHFGIDFLPVVIRYATRRGNQRGLTNLRFAVCDAETFLARHLDPASVAEIHCYHPQPYDHPDHVHRRMVTEVFLASIHRVLRPKGLFFLQTDNRGYWEQMLEVVSRYFDFEHRDEPWPDAPKGRTRREIIAIRRGLPVFRGMGQARDLSNDGSRPT